MSSPATGRLLLELLGSGPTSRAELARRLGLSTPTLTRLSKPLVTQGILRETTSAEPARAGRPSRPLEIVPTAARFAGVKISRDELDGVVIDLAGRVLHQRRVPVRAGSVSAVTRSAAALLHQLGEDEPGIAAAAVAIGARVADDRLVSAVAGFDWSDPDLIAPLRAGTSVPVELINDVHAYLLSEQWLGVGRGSRGFLVLTVGVGVGCAFTYEGELMAGANGSAGLVGHWPLTADGPACGLGHRGCASGWLPTEQVLARVAGAIGAEVELESAVALAADNPTVAAILADAAYQLGRLTGLVADVVGPARILLGGDGIAYVRFAESEVRRGLADTRHQSAASGELVISADPGFTDWARGAAVSALVGWVDRVAGESA